MTNKTNAVPVHFRETEPIEHSDERINRAVATLERSERGRSVIGVLGSLFSGPASGLGGEERAALALLVTEFTDNHRDCIPVPPMPSGIEVGQ